MCLHFLLFCLDYHALSNGFIYFVTASDIYQIFPIAHLSPDLHACLFGFGATSAVAPASRNVTGSSWQKKMWRFVCCLFCCYLVFKCFRCLFGFGVTSAPASRNADGSSWWQKMRRFVCCIFLCFLLFVFVFR